MSKEALQKIWSKADPDHKFNLIQSFFKNEYHVSDMKLWATDYPASRTQNNVINQLIDNKFRNGGANFIEIKRWDDFITEARAIGGTSDQGNSYADDAVDAIDALLTKLDIQTIDAASSQPVDYVKEMKSRLSSTL